MTHPTESPAYWRSLAANSRACAATAYRNGQGVDSIAIYEREADEYEAQARRIEDRAAKATGQQGGQS